MLDNRLDASTLIFGEEGHTTTISGEEDFATHAATERKQLQAVTTLILGEETTTFRAGEEFTTEALGEEGPTTTDGENPSPADFSNSRKGGPFGAY
jgi:hypothetical protein